MKRLLPYILLFLTLNTFAQKEANFWYFGNNAALDFNSGSPVPVTGSQLNTTEGCSSFSDAAGDLLFYVGAPTTSTSNLTIWDRNNNAMPNGVGLNGDASSSQSALTIPAPGQPNIYYLFTVGAQSSSNAGFWFYTIDMTANGGLGDIVAGPVVLGNATDHSRWTEKVTAVRSATCNEFWVISSHSDNFYAYKVNNGGVDVSNPQISNIPGYTANDPRGYLKVSPDGTKLVSANMGDRTFIFDFDDTSGTVTNFNGGGLSQLNLNGDGYGVEFSVSSQRLYVSTGAFNNAVENLYQFDVTLPTITDINNSRFLVHSYNNTRGALQLGPDAKIYWTSSGSTNISVINNPEEIGAAVNYSHQTVGLGAGVTASQGLPPFLSSLLLPIEIKDTTTNQVINNLNLEFCTGESKTITPEVVTGNNITHEWFFDNGTTTTTVTTTPSLSLTNLALTDTGKYNLVVKLTDACGNVTQLEGTFNIEVFEAASATKPDDIIFCDSDNDGFNMFDLQTDKTPEILNGQDPSVFEVLYFDSLVAAQNNVAGTAFSNPYTNPTMFSDQTIYARVHNRSATSVCFAITDFRLAVTGLPVAQTPTNYNICDNTSVGTDIDGFITGFILNTKDAEILGTLDPTQFTVTYHTSLVGAQTDATTDVIDKTTPYTNTSVTSQPIFVRVENVDNTACNDTSQTFNIVVNPLPIITNVVELQQCDNDTDAFSNFNLNEAASDISDDFANETFTFYPTLADANADLNAFTAAEALVFTNRTVTTDTVWARAITTFGCYRISEVNLTVSTTGISNAFQRSFNTCDDYLDVNGDNTAANDDTDGLATFDFSSVTAEIRAIFPPTQLLTITYYRNEADALAEINVIADPSNYRNIGYPNTQGIYVRVDSNLDNDCLGFGRHITLTVDPAPSANTVPSLELCDDLNDGNSTNGIVQLFDLESQTDAILGTQNPTNYAVSYHLSSVEANSGANPLVSPFTNTIRDTQTIFVRVEGVGCYTAHTSFDLIVNPLPVANIATPIEVCDDNSDGSATNGFSQSIDLSSRTAEILGIQDPTQFSVSYHVSLANAQSGTFPLTTTGAYSNTTPFRETIYVRVFNSTTQCANGISTFDIIVHPEPNILITDISNYSLCDNDSDGIVESFDFTTKEPEILTNYPVAEHDDFIITYFTSQADAIANVDQISDAEKVAFTNTPSASGAAQRIFVRVENKDTSCVNDDTFFDLIVNPLPIFNVTSPQIVCLNDTPLVISAENPLEAGYSYVWTDLADGTIIGNLQNQDVFKAGTYRVTAINSVTGCESFDDIDVNPSHPAVITLEDLTIIDDSDNNSIAIRTDNLGIGDYRFALTDTSGNFIRNYQDEPLFENLPGNIYRILVRDENGCDINGVPSVDVAVVEFPKFFTPNGDSINDTWEIKGTNSTFFPLSEIYIFNRYGKVVSQIKIDERGWDGTYNGKELASDDYWFSIKLIDANNIVRERSGHFSMIRK
jgi:gliding motility-associated-like protein